MSYIYLVEQEAGSWEECSSDTPQFALWKLKSTQDECCCNDSETESCQSSQSGAPTFVVADNCPEAVLSCGLLVVGIPYRELPVWL